MGLAEEINALATGQLWGEILKREDEIVAAGDAASLWQLGRAAMRQSDMALAIFVLRRALEHSGPATDLGGKILIDLAVSFSRCGDNDSSDRILQMYLANFERYAHGLMQLGAIYYSLGYNAEERQDFEAALKHFRQAERAWKQWPDRRQRAELAVAETLRYSLRPLEARAVLDGLAPDLLPDNRGFYLQIMAEMQRDQGDLEGARETALAAARELAAADAHGTNVLTLGYVYLLLAELHAAGGDEAAARMYATLAEAAGRSSTRLHLTDQARHLARRLQG